MRRLTDSSIPVRTHYYRFGKDGESEEGLCFSVRKKKLEELILAEGPDTVAALIAEPLMGAGGVIPPPKTYFEKIQEVLKRHDVLLIADEVINGFGKNREPVGMRYFRNRRPRHGHLCEAIILRIYSDRRYDDLGKKFTRQLREASARHGVFGTGFTYGGHPVGAAVGLETLRIL